MLVIDELTVGYQQLMALRGVSLRVEKGSLTALIGSNGSGKTTLLNTISGLIRPPAGRILFEGHDISRLRPDEICRLGVVQCPEGRKLFPQMTVRENLEMGAYLPHARGKLRESLDMVWEMFPRLAERMNQPAGNLSGGEQQMAALGRALTARPRVLMLDEPSLGLAPVMASTIFSIILKLNSEGMTILLVSQEILQTLRISGSAYLLENGKIVLSGSAGAVREDPRVKSAYLGI